MGWPVVQSSIPVTTITLEQLRRRGYEAMLTVYRKMALLSGICNETPAGNGAALR